MELSKGFIDPPANRPKPGHTPIGKRRGFLLLGFLMTLPAILLGRSLADRLETRRVAKADEELLLTARMIARNVGLQVDEYAKAAEMLAKQVEAWGTLEPVQLQKIVTTEKAAFPGLALMYVGSADGISIAVEPPFDKFGTPNAGTNYRDRDYYQEVVRTGKTFISKARLGRVSHVPNIQIASPIWDEKGHFIAFSQDAIDLLNIFPARVEEILSGRPNIKAIVIDREGQTLAHPDRTAVEELRDLSKHPLFKATTQATGELRRGVDETGAAVHAAIVPVLKRDLNWQVIVYQSEASLKTEAVVVRRQVWMITAAGLLTGLFFVVIAAWLNASRRSTKT